MFSVAFSKKVGKEKLFVKISFNFSVIFGEILFSCFLKIWYNFCTEINITFTCEGIIIQHEFHSAEKEI